jgi:hypothetical protein
MFGAIKRRSLIEPHKGGIAVLVCFQFSFDGSHSNLQAASFCCKLNCSRLSGFSADNRHAKAIERISVMRLKRFGACGITVVRDDDFARPFNVKMDAAVRPGRHQTGLVRHVGVAVSFRFSQTAVDLLSPHIVEQTYGAVGRITFREPPIVIDGNPLGGESAAMTNPAATADKRMTQNRIIGSRDVI